MYNSAVQTDTVWNATYNNTGQTIDIINSEQFQVSESQREAITGSRSNYGDQLTINHPNSSMKIVCGSHAEPNQTTFKVEVCGKFI